MNILTLALLTASMAGAGPATGPAQATRSDDGSVETAVQPEIAQEGGAIGGGDDRIVEPPAVDPDVALPTIVVVGREPAHDMESWTIAPDPALARRYDAPGDRRFSPMVVRF